MVTRVTPDLQLGDDRPARAPGRRREAGFTMVVLVVILAIMTIWLAVAVQAVSFHMRREREAELIFRGEQYVEAIRLYRMRYGRYPMTLREIWEADPKVVRKRWKDPIKNSEAWGLVHLGQEGQPIKPGEGLPGQTPTPAPEATPTPTPGTGPGSGQGGDQQVGPIIGVVSTSCDESIRVYQGRTRYCDWKFVFRDQPPRPVAPHPPN
jgi:type II secretory pathway pseudopilin PulG